MFEGLLKSKFYTKSKSDIKLIRARIDMVLKKRNAMLNYMRKDVADLLKNGLDINAYGRVDGLLVELNRSSCYEFIEQSSLQVLNHLVVMNKQRECPEDCKEAVSSLMLAAARFADLPELRELRTLFLENYGDSMNSYANKEFVQKLKSGGSPSKDMKLQLLQDVASEYGLQWNSKDLRNKLRNDPVTEKSFGTKRIEDKCNIRDESRSNSVEKTGPGGAEHECKNLREVDVPKRRNDLSIYGHEEATEIKDKVLSKTEDVTSPRDSNDVPQMLKMSDGGPAVKDIQVHREAGSDKEDGSESVKRVVLEVENHENRPQNLKAEKRENRAAIKYNSVPDHVKNEVTDKNFHLSEYKYSTRDKQKEDDRTGFIGRANSVPKSVRTRHVRPPPIHENASNSAKRDHLKENKENVGEGRRILKFLDGGCNNQEDEKMMDELLLHYSKKKGPQDPRKSSSNRSPADSSDATKRSRDGPNRTTSLPCETLRPAETTKVHTRASSFEPEIVAKEHAHGHVHPKLPEYDEFVARLASLREKV